MSKHDLKSDLDVRARVSGLESFSQLETKLGNAVKLLNVLTEKSAQLGKLNDKAFYKVTNNLDQSLAHKGSSRKESQALTLMMKGFTKDYANLQKNLFDKLESAAAKLDTAATRVIKSQTISQGYRSGNDSLTMSDIRTKSKRETRDLITGMRARMDQNVLSLRGDWLDSGNRKNLEAENKRLAKNIEKMEKHLQEMNTSTSRTKKNAARGYDIKDVRQRITAASKDPNLSIGDAKALQREVRRMGREIGRTIEQNRAVGIVDDKVTGQRRSIEGLLNRVNSLVSVLKDNKVNADGLKSSEKHLVGFNKLRDQIQARASKERISELTSATGPDAYKKIKGQLSSLNTMSNKLKDIAAHWKNIGKLGDKELRQLEEQNKLLNEAMNNLRSREQKMAAVNAADRGKQQRAQAFSRVTGDGGAALLGIQAQLGFNYGVLNALTGGAAEAVRYTVELQKELKQLQAITATTDSQMGLLADRLIDISQKTKFTSVEVVQSAVTLGQAGFSTEQITKSMEAITLFATATGTDLKSSVDIATSVLGVFNKAADETSLVMDQMTTAINTSKLNTEKLALGIQYAGNIASQSGVEFTELVGALGAMANSGIRAGSTLGTGMRQILIALMKPSEGFKKNLESMGLSMDDVDVKTRGLYAVLKTLRDNGFTAAQAIESFEVRAASAFNALANNLHVMKDLEEAQLYTGAASKANATQMEALAHQWDRFASVVKTTVSTALGPTIDFLTDKLRSLSDTLEAINDMPWSDTMWKGLGTLAAVIASLTVGGMLVSMTTGMLGLVGTLQATATSSVVATRALGILTIAIKTLRGGLVLFGAVGLAIAGVSAAMGLFSDRTETAAEKMDRLQGEFDVAKGKVEETTEVIKLLDREIQTLSNRRIELMKPENKQEMLQQFEEIKNALYGVGLALSEGVADSIPAMKEALQQLKDEQLKIKQIQAQGAREAAERKLANLTQQESNYGAVQLGTGLDYKAVRRDLRDQGEKGERALKLLDDMFIQRRTPKASDAESVERYLKAIRDKVNNPRDLDDVVKSLQDLKTLRSDIKKNQEEIRKSTAIEKSAGLQLSPEFKKLEKRAEDAIVAAETKRSAILAKKGLSDAERYKLASEGDRESILPFEDVEGRLNTILIDLKKFRDAQTSQVEKNAADLAISKVSNTIEVAMTAITTRTKDYREEAAKEAGYNLRQVTRINNKDLKNILDSLKLTDRTSDAKSLYLQAQQTAKREANAQLTHLKDYGGKDKKEREGNIRNLLEEELERISTEFSGALLRIWKKDLKDSTTEFEKTVENVRDQSKKRKSTTEAEHLKGLKHERIAMDLPRNKSHFSQGARDELDRQIFDQQIKVFQEQLVNTGIKQAAEQNLQDSIRKELSDTTKLRNDYASQISATDLNTDPQKLLELTEKKKALDTKIARLTDMQQKSTAKLLDYKKEILGVETKIAEVTTVPEQETLFEGASKAVKNYKRDLDATQVGISGVTNVLNTSQSAFSSLYGNIIQGNQSLGDSFKQFGATVIQAMQQVIAEMLAVQTMQALLDLGTDSGNSSSSGGSSLLSSAGSALMGMLGGGGLTESGPGLSRAAGGPIVGGIPNRDSVLVNSMPGEYMVNKSAVASVGIDFMNKLNRQGAGALTSHMGVAAGGTQIIEKSPVNVWAVSQDQVPPPGPRDIIATVGDNIARGGSLKKLIKSM